MQRHSVEVTEQSLQAHVIHFICSCELRAALEPSQHAGE